MSFKGRFAIWAATIYVIAMGVFFAGCYDDPFYPRPPDFYYKVDITGLENFSTDNGSAVIMVPVPAVDGEPILKEGWWPNNRSRYDREYHGTKLVRPATTGHGAMLALWFNMTDYYDSYARVTPIAIHIGQNESEIPTVVPDRMYKNWSFDIVSTVLSGYVGKLDFPTSAQGRQEVIKFLDRPLSPAKNGTDSSNYTSYVYIDESLVPLRNGSRINISVALTVHLNHNKVNVSEEGARRFEIHEFTVNESIPGGAKGFIPVRVNHTYYSSINY